MKRQSLLPEKMEMLKDGIPSSCSVPAATFQASSGKIRRYGAPAVPSHASSGKVGGTATPPYHLIGEFLFY